MAKNLKQEGCINYFLLFWWKTMTKSNLEKEQFVLAYSSKGLSSCGGKAWYQAAGAGRRPIAFPSYTRSTGSKQEVGEGYKSTKCASHTLPPSRLGLQIVPSQTELGTGDQQQV